MTKNTFDLPDMGDLAQQLEDAMSEAQKAMEDLPAQVGGLGDVMGSLSTLMGGMPAQMEDLGAALAGFDAQHEANVETLAGEPDWSVAADIRVGEKLHVVVRAGFDFGQIAQAWNSTQGSGFETLVAGVVGETDTDPGLMGQIMGQLQKGRAIAVVRDVQVLACRIQGAPRDAASTLQLSPEGNIPLLMDEDGLGFELAPVLTIRNKWEHADMPTFSPMGEALKVPLHYFERGAAFSLTFEPDGQDDAMRVTLQFQPCA